MNKNKHYLTINLLLAVISIIALVFIHMALTDIYHGGEDLKLEWNVIRGCVAIIGIFVLFTVFTLIKLLRSGILKSNTE